MSTKGKGLLMSTEGEPCEVTYQVFTHLLLMINLYTFVLYKNHYYKNIPEAQISEKIRTIGLNLAN